MSDLNNADDSKDVDVEMEDGDFDLCGDSGSDASSSFHINDYSDEQDIESEDLDLDPSIDPVTRCYRGFEFDTNDNVENENGFFQENTSNHFIGGEVPTGRSFTSFHERDHRLNSNYTIDTGSSSPAPSPNKFCFSPTLNKHKSYSSLQTDSTSKSISPLSIHEEDIVPDNESTIQNEKVESDVVPLKYTLDLKSEDEMTKDNEITFKYQYDLRVYVNRCMFIRHTKIGKRVGFAPSLPKTKDFVMCWNCNDWIPPGISPPCIPMCSQTHMHSKYVFEKMFGYFCSWGCCKKYIYETMSNANKSKYMRSLLQFRRIFYPELTNQPIETVEPRTITKPYGGSMDTDAYYSKMVKINLPPLAEDISLTFKDLKFA